MVRGLVYMQIVGKVGSLEILFWWGEAYMKKVNC